MTWWPGGRVSAYAAGAPSMTSPRRGDRDVERRPRGLPRARADQRHRVVGERARAGADRGGDAPRGLQPGVREQVGHDAVLVARQAGGVPVLPGVREVVEQRRVVHGERGRVGLLARADERRAERRRGSAPPAPAPRSRACARPATPRRPGRGGGGGRSTPRASRGRPYRVRARAQPALTRAADRRAGAGSAQLDRRRGGRARRARHGRARRAGPAGRARRRAHRA